MFVEMFICITFRKLVFYFGSLKYRESFYNYKMA